MCYESEKLLKLVDHYTTYTRIYIFFQMFCIIDITLVLTFLPLSLIDIGAGGLGLNCPPPPSIFIGENNRKSNLVLMEGDRAVTNQDVIQVFIQRLLINKVGIHK